MLLELIATLCAGLFAGAAIYITFVEHPARWGRLHAVRSVLSGVAFGVLAWHLARPG